MKAACKSTEPKRRKTPADFRKRADVFKALSNPNRLLIVDALSAGERCVAELTELVGLDMSTVSNHLAVLAQCWALGGPAPGMQVFSNSLKTPCVTNIFCCLDEFDAGNER